MSAVHYNSTMGYSNSNVPYLPLGDLYCIYIELCAFLETKYYNNLSIPELVLFSDQSGHVAIDGQELIYFDNFQDGIIVLQDVIEHTTKYITIH